MLRGLPSTTRRSQRNPFPSSVLPVAAVVTIALVLAGCSQAHSSSASASSSGTAAATRPVTKKVTPDRALDVSLPGVVHVMAPAGTFATSGTVTLTPASSPDPGVTGVGLAGEGVTVSFADTSPAQPLHIVFTRPSARPTSDSLPTALHHADDGTWETVAAEAAGGGIAVDASSFSSWFPSWLNPVDWLKDLVHSTVNGFIARTDAPACANDGPTWATLQKNTTLVHACLVTNTDAQTGAARAEVQLAPNRAYYIWTYVPAGVQYAWLSNQPTALRAVLGKLIPGLKSDTQVMISPGSLMTSGATQPTSDTTLTYRSFIDGWSVAMSLTNSVLNLVQFDPKPEQDLLDVLWFVKGCVDKVPSSATDLSGTWEFTKCVVENSLELLSNPAKAIGAATDFMGDRVYAQNGVDDLTKMSGRLKLLGEVFKVVGLAGAVHDIWAEIPDAFSQMGADHPGDTLLALQGKPAVTTVSLTGFGGVAWGTAQAAAESALGGRFTLQNMGNGCAQASLSRWPSATFGIQNGQLAVVAIGDKSVGTDTGLHVGDPVSKLKAAYPGITSSPDPSDAYSTRYEITRNGQTAQFISTNGSTISSMQFGLSGSVGEAPCV
jgi:hypothetical protein